MKIREMRKKAVLGLAAVLLAASVPVSAVQAEGGGREVPHYDIRKSGGTGDGTNYFLSDGTMVKDAFFCDGTYTYYLMADGSPMKDRLTYHPDGEHIIYFDADGHEVFSNFTHVVQSIAGEEVDDLCFFDVYGYMYVDVLTYDQAGEHLYYANSYGVMERNGWFQFSDGGYGYANTDGTLMTDQYTYDWNGKLVYMEANGHVRGSGQASTDEWAESLYNALLKDDCKTVMEVLIDVSNVRSHCAAYEDKEWARWDSETAYRMTMSDGQIMGIVVYEYESSWEIYAFVSEGDGFSFIEYGDHMVGMRSDGSYEYLQGGNKHISVRPGEAPVYSTVSPDDVYIVWHV